MSCNSSGCCPEPLYPGCPDASHPLTVFPYGPVYDGTLDLYFPSKWEFGWLENSVILVHDSGLTWISDEFTYNGETCIATLVITGIGSGQATLTIETTSIYLGNVVYKNEAFPFETLGPNRMVVHGSSTWTPETGSYLACLYPYETYYDCTKCEEGDLSGFVIDSTFQGEQIYRLDEMLAYDDPDISDICSAYPDDVVTYFGAPPGDFDLCGYVRRWCSGGATDYTQVISITGGGGSFEIDVKETDVTSGSPVFNYYRKTFTARIDCKDDETIHTLTRYTGSGPSTITFRFTRV